MVAVRAPREGLASSKTPSPEVEATEYRPRGDELNRRWTGAGLEPAVASAGRRFASLSCARALAGKGSRKDAITFGRLPFVTIADVQDICPPSPEEV